MYNYLIVYRTAENRIENTVVSWDRVTTSNIRKFESEFDDEDFLCIINIIKLDD